MNLADSWSWFLNDIYLLQYWSPEHRFPFLNSPKSTAGGFHITTEGKEDPTGVAGGGYDVRIKTGVGSHLLFIQFKKGDLEKASPSPLSEFEKVPSDHFKFNINGTSTNQHFVLRDLADGIGGENKNAVVYAFPLIDDMEELEANSGRLIRKTKFVSVADIDAQAKANGVSFERGHTHNFRVGKFDMSRCEVNFYFFFFYGIDRTPGVISDMLGVKLQKTLTYFMKNAKKQFKEVDFLVEGLAHRLQSSFFQFLKYLLHYFEVSPSKLDVPFFKVSDINFYEGDFPKQKNNKRDVEILTSVFSSLSIFEEYFRTINENPDKIFVTEVPHYVPINLISGDDNNELRIKFDSNTPEELIDGISYMTF